MYLHALLLWTFLFATAPADAASAAQVEWDGPQEVRLSLLTLWGATTPSNQWVFVATREWWGGDQNANQRLRMSLPTAVLPDLEALKQYLATLPRGSTVTWARSCLGPFDEEHPLSSDAKVEEFETACHEHGVNCRILPSG